MVLIFWLLEDAVKVDWFEDELTEIHKKVRTKDTIANHKQIEECVDMMRSHRDKKFKDELAKIKEEVGILEEKENQWNIYLSCSIRRAMC